jgi:16S rRNA (guanine966-N2)-methyltransferase
MTRIIAGAVGGRTLRTPAGSRTRPTSERVREALFSALEARDAVHGAAVLDLYAGSGALGLEAASRGARTVVLVESDRRAADVAARNARDLGLAQVHVARRDVAAHLGDDPGGPVDLALLDPPYDVGEEELAAVLHRLAEDWLADDAVVVVERSSRSTEPAWPPGLELVGRARRYGETTVWVAEVTSGPSRPGGPRASRRGADPADRMDG